MDQLQQRVIVLILSLFLLPSTAQLIAQKKVQSPSKADIEKLLDQANPGPEHDLLATFSGKWNVSVTAGSAKTSGTGRSYMTMERRFLWVGYDTRSSNAKFKGAFIIGFDRRNEEFTLIALDTMGTYFVTSKGKKSPDSKSVKLFGKDNDPYMKKLGLTKEFAHKIDFSDPENLKIQVIYIDNRTKDRKEQVAMEYSFQRQKADAK